MANMEYIQAQTNSANQKFVESLGNHAINRINKQYGEAVDEMFERLHKQKLDVQLTGEARQEMLRETGGGYERVGFRTKSQRDAFVRDMQEQGVDVTYATEKVGGQWLVEIPKSVKIKNVREGSDLAEFAQQHKLTSDRVVSAKDILDDFSNRTKIDYQTPTPVEQREEVSVGTVRLGLGYKLTAHMGSEAGKVINKAVGITNEMEKYHVGSDRRAIREGRVTSGQNRKAVVIGGDTVLIDGKVVTDERIRGKVLKRHRKKMEIIHKTKAADFIISKTDDLNKTLGRRAEKTNSTVKKRSQFVQSFDRKSHPIFVSFHEGLGRKVYQTDIYNPEAKQVLGDMLTERGFSTKPEKIVYAPNGDVFGAVYTDGKKKITVVHKHTDALTVKPPLTQVWANKKKMQEATYRQEYALENGSMHLSRGSALRRGRINADTVKVAEGFKDLSMSINTTDTLQKLLVNDRGGVFTYAQAQAITELYKTGMTSSLSLRERQQFVATLRNKKITVRDSIADGEGIYTKDDLKEIDNAIKEAELSDYEKAQLEQTDKDGNIVQSLIKIDFGLMALEEIASMLNEDFNITQIAKQLDFSDVGTLRFEAGGQSGASEMNVFEAVRTANIEGVLNLSHEEIAVLDKIRRNPNAQLTARERVQLESALKKYKYTNGDKLSSENMAVLDDTLSRIKIDDLERASVKKIMNLENDFGIKITNANFNAEKVLEMNKVLFDRATKAGINIFEKKGNRWRVATSKLELIKQSPAVMKKLGMSETTLDTLIKTNNAAEEAILANPNMDFLSAFAQRKGAEILSKMGGDDEYGNVGDLLSAREKIKTGAGYAKSGVVAIRNHTEALRKRRQIKRANKSGYGKSKGKINSKKNKPKKKDEKDKLLYNAKQAKIEEMSASAVKAQEKAVEKALKREKTVLGRAQKLKAQAMSKLANSALGKLVLGVKGVIGKFLITPALIVGGVVLLIEAVIIIIIIILMTISAFLDAINPVNWINNALAPETYADTVAYTLYEDYLAVREKEWLKEDLGNFKTMYDERVDLKYGSNYEDFQTYLSHFDEIILKDDDGNGYYSDPYINPFAASGVWNDQILHEGWDKDREVYDGSRTMTIGTNNNIYGKSRSDTVATDIEKLEYGFSTVESGHTCNIKDILCMTDVMYGMDLSKMSEADFKNDASIMGKSPEQVTFDDSVENVVGFFKWLWNTIKSINPFSDTKYEPLKNFCNDKVGMTTIIKYAETLYESSHQQEVALDVQFHDVKPLVLQTDAGAEDVTTNIRQETASSVGYCVNPVKTKFYLKWNNDSDGHGARVSPFFTENEDGSGTQFITDLPKSESSYKVQVDMSNYAASEDPCITAEMKTNDEATFLAIEALANGTNANSSKTSCWSKTEDAAVQMSVSVTKANTGGNKYYTKRISAGGEETGGDDGWYDSLDDAKNNVTELLQTAYDEKVAAMPEIIYTLTSTKNKESKIYCETVDFEVEFGDYVTREKPNGNDLTKDYYWDGDETKGAITDIWITNKNGDQVWSGYASSTSDISWETSGDDVRIKFHPARDPNGWGYSSWINNGEANFPMSWHTNKHTYIVNEMKTQYKYTNAKVKVYDTKRTTYERNCTGHDFAYCGGHIGMYSHGVVYSMTNEQIALSTVRDENSGNPLADGFDLAEHGYDNLRGKIIKNEVNYDTVESAATSGGCASPLYDPQGSASGMYGLNLKTEAGEWVDGYKTRSDEVYHQMRDIFDIDTLILKGDNIFPLQCDYTKFEGWNSDNMTLAILKWVADWYDEYGFDIPQEIYYGELGEEADDGTITPYETGYDGMGQAPLSQQDINTIVDALKARYSEAEFDEEREQAVRLALGFVGKGHYNPYHDHDFLAEACDGVTIQVRDPEGNESYVNYDGCCTAGTEESFTNYIRRHFGKIRMNGRADFTYRYNVPYTYSGSDSNAYPADVIAHIGADNALDVEIPVGELTGFGNVEMYQLEDLTRFRTVFFVGIVDEDIPLSTGQVIKAGAPITIDLTQCGRDNVTGIGNIYLHGYNGGNLFVKNSFENYPWLYDDTSRTKLVRFN